jgi:serine/threonine-protein kinase HipA
MSSRCLYCYLPLDEKEHDFHSRCSVKFFGAPTPPALDLSKEKLEEMAKQLVARSVAVTGVQPKLSLTTEPIDGDNKKLRLTIVGVMGGNFILKPPSDQHPSLPENEDLTMHLAQLVGINTSEHSLIRLTSGELAYITKRFDRIKEEKLPCEDLCQLSEQLTEHKYRGSMEKAGKTIKQYSNFPMLDVVNFFELAVFSFVTGNADMHLKNFSILKNTTGNYRLSPCYDLLSTKLTEDPEEMALTINGRTNKITRKDFEVFGSNIGLTPKQLETVFSKLAAKRKDILEFIGISFLPDDLKSAYAELIEQRLDRL